VTLVLIKANNLVAFLLLREILSKNYVFSFLCGGMDTFDELLFIVLFFLQLLHVLLSVDFIISVFLLLL